MRVEFGQTRKWMYVLRTPSEKKILLSWQMKISHISTFPQNSIIDPNSSQRGIKSDHEDTLWPLEGNRGILNVRPLCYWQALCQNVSNIPPHPYITPVEKHCIETNWVSNAKNKEHTLTDIENWLETGGNFN